MDLFPLVFLVDLYSVYFRAIKQMHFASIKKNGMRALLKL